MGEYGAYFEGRKHARGSMRRDLDLTDDPDESVDREMENDVEPPLSPDTDKVTWASMIASAAKNVKHNIMVGNEQRATSPTLTLTLFLTHPTHPTHPVGNEQRANNPDLAYHPILDLTYPNPP